jgi:prevent-host-death family protein
MKTLPLAEAKAKLSSVIYRVARSDNPIAITRNGRRVAVVVSADWYNGVRETQAVRSDRALLAEPDSFLRRGLVVDEGDRVVLFVALARLT